MQMLLLSPTLLTFSLVMCVCYITSDGSTRRLKALQKCCNTSASAFYFLFLSLPFSHSHQHHIVPLSICCCLFPFLFCSLCISAGLSWWIWVSGCLGESATFSGGNWSTPTQRWVSGYKEFPEETRTTFYCHSLSLKAAPTPELCTTWYACFKSSCIWHLSFTITVMATRLLRHRLESDATQLILSESKCSRCNQISTHPVLLCLYSRLFILFYFFVFISWHVCPDERKDATEQCVCSSAFILHPIKPLACPILFCSALRLLPSPWCRPSVPPLSLCCSIFLIFVSLAGQGVTWAEGRGRGGRRNVKTRSRAVIVKI